MAKFTIYKDTAGYYRWRCRASNGRIVADSAEAYYNKVDCQNGISIVRTEPATVEDLS